MLDSSLECQKEGWGENWGSICEDMGSGWERSRVQIRAIDL